MSNKLEHFLRAALLKLEEAEKNMAKQKQYNQETEKIRMLAELIKEQVKNEDSRHSAR